MSSSRYGLLTLSLITSGLLAGLYLLSPLIVMPTWGLTGIAFLVCTRWFYSVLSYSEHLKVKSNPIYCAAFKAIHAATPWSKQCLAYLGFRPISTHIIIGTAQSGKTQLLETCTPNPIIVDNCQSYWQGNHLIIDTPGIETGENAPWLIPLFQAIYTYRHSHPLQSISITFDALEADTANANAIITQVCEAHRQIMLMDKPACIQILVTKCDKMPEFTNAFNGISTEDKGDKFGLLFKHKNVVPNPEQAFGKRFAQLMDYLTDYLQDDQHPLLQHFEAISPSLLRMTKNVSEHGCFLRSICFCSTRTTPPLFLDEWLTQQHVPRVSQNAGILTHTLAVSIALAALICSGAWQIFQTNKAQMVQIEQQLHEAGLAHDPLLIKLDQLAKASRLSKSLPNPKIKLEQLKTLESQVTSAYQTAINNEFKPWIKQQLENALTHLSSATIKDFSVYMMLCDDRSRDDKAVNEWFNGYWQTHISPLERASAKTHLNTLLNKATLCSLNHPLISNAQAYLSKIPLEDLIITLTQDQLDKEQTSPKSSLPFNIDSIYTYKQFHTVYDHGLAENYQTLSKYKQEPENQSVLKRSKQQYLSHYRQRWTQALNSIHMPNFKNLEQADQAIASLYQGQHTLSSSLNTIITNTSQPSDLVFNSHIKSALGKTPLNSEQLGIKVDSWLKKLHEYIIHLHSGKSNTFVFEQSKQRMLDAPKDGLSYLKQQTHDFPPHVSAWLNQLVEQTWKCMLSASLNHLNKEWNRTIYQEYAQHIEARYPLFPEATVDIDTASFTHFFGPESALQKFIEDNLSPFIEKDKSGWSWKQLEGLALSQSNKSAEALMKANAIKTMFFTNTKSKSALMHWQLTPESLSQTLAQMKIISPSTSITFKPKQLQQHSINIAMPMKEPSITLTFNDTHHLSTSQVYQGPWAWLRALQRAAPKTPSDGDTKHFSLTFRFNEATAQFNAETKDAVNPLTTGILDAFRCPKIL